MTLLVGPSQQRRRWQEFFASSQWNPGEFRSLIDSDPPGAAPNERTFRRVVTDVKRLSPEREMRARAILSAIDGKSADTEMLMEGVQLCLDLMGQHLFTDITAELYGDGRQPGPIYRSIAAVAAPQMIVDRGGWFPGWDAIITYNFDDLMGEALDAAGLARAAYAMRGEQVAGDPNEKARAAGSGSLHQAIYHLHGYTPRKPFLITTVKFVFSTSQYLEFYKEKRNGIIDHVFRGWLANPVHHALYVGCSFQDEAMNRLLRDAAEVLPGRYHYALLKWSGGKPYTESSAEDIALESATWEAMGVRPVWFDSFGEVPQLIAQLA